MAKVQPGGIPYVLAGLVVPHVVCTVFIILRVISRAVCLRKWYADDSLMVLAWLCSTGVCVVYGMAIHLHHHREHRLEEYLLRTYLGLVFYQLSLCLSKLSIAAFYLRMLSIKPAMKWLSWATIALVIGFGIPLLIMSFLQCYPTADHVLGRPMVCFGFTELLVFSACVHTVLDAWLIILIVPTISRLELPRRQKTALSIILSLGIFVIAASMIRLQLSLQKDFRPTAGARGSNAMAFFVMTILECDTAIICASAAVLRPVFSLLKSPFKRKPAPPQENNTGFTLTTVVNYYGYPWEVPNRLPQHPPPVRPTPSRQDESPPRLTKSTPRSMLESSRRSRLSRLSRYSTASSFGNVRVVIPRTYFQLSSRVPTSAKGHNRDRSDITPMLGEQNMQNAEQATPGEFLDPEDDLDLAPAQKQGSKFKGPALKPMEAVKLWSNSQESFIPPLDPASPMQISRVFGLRDSTGARDSTGRFQLAYRASEQASVCRSSLENNPARSVKDAERGP